MDHAVATKPDVSLGMRQASQIARRSMNATRSTAIGGHIWNFMQTAAGLLGDGDLVELELFDRPTGGAFHCTFAQSGREEPLRYHLSGVDGWREARQKQQFRLSEEAMKAMSLGATLDGPLHVFCYVTPRVTVPTFRNVLLLQCSFNFLLGTLPWKPGGRAIGLSLVLQNQHAPLLQEGHLQRALATDVGHLWAQRALIVHPDQIVVRFYRGMFTEKLYHKVLNAWQRYPTNQLTLDIEGRNGQ